MIVISIDQKATDKRIKDLMLKHNIQVKDLQKACGFDRPQAVYKWLRGASLPSIESLLILQTVFSVSIDDMIVFKKLDDDSSVA